RPVRIREEQIRRVSGHRRTRAASGRQGGCDGHLDRCQRIQLSGTDSAGNRPPRNPPGRTDSDPASISEVRRFDFEPQIVRDTACSSGAGNGNNVVNTASFESNRRAIETSGSGAEISKMPAIGGSPGNNSVTKVAKC